MRSPHPPPYWERGHGSRARPSLSGGASSLSEHKSSPWCGLSETLLTCYVFPFPPSLLPAAHSADVILILSTNWNVYDFWVKMVEDKRLIKLLSLFWFESPLIQTWWTFARCGHFLLNVSPCCWSAATTHFCHQVHSLVFSLYRFMLQSQIKTIDLSVFTCWIEATSWG